MTPLLPLVVALGLFIGVVGWIKAWMAFAHLRFVAFHRDAGQTPPPLGLIGGLAFYVQVVTSVLIVAAWTVRRLLSNGLRNPAAGRTAPPVLFVHGFHMTGGAMWGLRSTVERDGHPTQAVHLGLPYRSAEAYALPLTTVLERLVDRFPDQPIDVVAHSMGGLVLRHVLAREPGLARHLGRVVTLGSPHRGTAFVRWHQGGPVYAMMGRDCDYIRDLPTIASTAPHAQVTTVASRLDMVVYPLDTAHLDDAEQITVDDVSHIGLLTDRAVAELTARALRRP